MGRFARLLHPKSLAVVGGGPWGEAVIQSCRATGFTGEVWPVHPNRAEVAGLAAVAHVDALPEAPDAVFVGVNRVATIEVVRALNGIGAGGAVCFASGFLEAVAENGDGAEMQSALLEAAGEMPLIGPNCYGLINLLDGAALWPDQHGAARVERGVAIITQSSNIALNLTMQRRGLPIAYVGTVGNQAQTGFAALGRAMIEDPRVSALGLHIEGVGDLHRLEELARAAHALAKPIVALKVGASDHAQNATISHTASLAGSDAGASALFERLGIGRVSGLTAFLETLKLLHVVGPLASNRIASLSCSGGEAALIADRALYHDVSFPPLDATQKAQLRDALGPKVALANPLDYHTYIWGDRSALTRTFTALMHSAFSIGCIVLDYPRGDRAAAPAWDAVVDAAIDTMAATGTPMALVSSIQETMPEDVARDAVARGLVPLAGIDDALEAIALAAKLGRRGGPTEPLLPAGPLEAGRTLGEAEAKATLAAHGLDVPQARRAEGPSAAVAAANAIGFPVVLKGEGAAHKTEAGLVALGLADPDAVHRAAEAMPATMFLVEELVGGGGAELIVGVLRDPAHGFVLTIGAGGVLTEILRDTVSLLAPVGEAEIHAALDRLRIAPLLLGYRGAPPANRKAIVSAVMAVQDYLIANVAEVVELEVNPLICTPTRAVAADALIRLGDPA